jgi:hypothetical protein
MIICRVCVSWSFRVTLASWVHSGSSTLRATVTPRGYSGSFKVSPERLDHSDTTRSLQCLQVTRGVGASESLQHLRFTPVLGFTWTHFDASGTLGATSVLWNHSGPHQHLITTWDHSIASESLGTSPVPLGYPPTIQQLWFGFEPFWATL